MNVQQARDAACEWIEINRAQYPGLRAAHLVGSITSMDPEADFPMYKDLDFHLVIEDDSPALIPKNPFGDIIETDHRGVVLEGGLKSVSQYSSVEAIVANPEIAHHLTLDSILYDLDRLLTDLQPGIRQAYPRRRWVLERIEFERRGLEGMLRMLPMGRQMGPATQANLLGYSFTYVVSLLCIVNLRSPTTGSRMFLHFRKMLADLGREDLFEETMAILGLKNIQGDLLQQYLRQGEEAFDLAVQVKRTPVPFHHKINPHQRAYFTQSVQSLIAEGHEVSAVGWLTPFFVTTHNIILADGPDADKPKYAAQLENFLHSLELNTAEKCDTAFARARRVHEACFDIARRAAQSFAE